MKNLLLSFIIIVILTSAKKPKHNMGQNADFKCIEASEQTLYPGIYGAATSNSFKIKLVVLRKFKLKLDSAFAKGKVEKYVIGRNKIQYDSFIFLKPKDTIDLFFNFRDYPLMPNGENMGESSKNGLPPIKINHNQALLKYFGGKNKWLIINNITKKEEIFAP